MNAKRILTATTPAGTTVEIPTKVAYTHALAMVGRDGVNGRDVDFLNSLHKSYQAAMRALNGRDARFYLDQGVSVTIVELTEV